MQHTKIGTRFLRHVIKIDPVTLLMAFILATAPSTMPGGMATATTHAMTNGVEGRSCRSHLAHASNGRSPHMTYSNVCEHARNCKRVSPLVMGTDHLAKVPNSQILRMLNEAVRLGINSFDTAPIYVNGIEARLGAWLKEMNREDLVVITKGGFPRDLGPGTYSSRLKGSQSEIIANVLEEIEGSSRRLNHKIDIYLMHRDDVDFQDFKQIDRDPTPIPQILEALSSEQIRSQFSMVGLSNWEDIRVNQTQTTAHERPSLVRPVVNSPYFSLMEMSKTTIHSGGVQVTHDQMIKPDFQPGVVIMPYSPLGGFGVVGLTEPGWNKAKSEALKLKKDEDRYWGHVYDAIFHEENRLRYRRAERFLKRFNLKHRTTYTLDQLLNAYVLAHPRTDHLIIGPLSVEQLRRTVASLELAKKLTPANLEYLYRNP